MKLTQVDVLAKDRSSTIASAIGGDVDQIRRSVSIDAEPSLEVTPIVGASTWQDFAERRILKLTYASAPIELWEIEQIGFSRGQQPGQKDLTCRPLWMRLDDQIAHLTLSDGTKDPNLTLTSVDVTTALNRVLGAAWNSPAFINPGSIDSAIQESVVNLFRSAATHKEWLTAIKEDLNVQWTARWDSAAGEYKVDLVERIGDPDASVRTIRETQQSQGDIVNRLRLRGERSVDNYFSGVVPLGGTKNQSLTMAGARWPISSTSYDSTNDETTIVFQDEPVWEDGVLTNAQVTNGGSAHAVQSSSAPDQVVVSGDVSGWDVLWFVDGSGDDLIELRDLDAESQVGRRTRSKRFSGVVPQENLLERAGVNTAADSLDGWAGVGSNTNLTVVTSGDYVRNGDGSIEVITSTADEEEGIRTGSIAFDKAAMGEVVSAFVAVYVGSGGTIQVQLVDKDGKEYPADETIEGGEATLRGYTIEGAKPPTGDLFLKVTTLSGDPTFYVDAATIVASAKARGFAPAMGPRALWQKGAGHLLREGGVPDRTLDGQVVDLSVLESRGEELTLGDATTVILHDGAEIEGRITSTQRDLVVGRDTTAFQVALGEPIDNALERFFDPASGESTGDGTGGTDRVQPVLQSVEMSQSGPVGELSFEVSDPLGVVQKVQTRTAEGRNLDPDNDSYSDLTPAAGTYTETVGLVESHNSYIQVRVVTGPQVDDVTREFTFDRDQIPEASYEVKWQYNDQRDTVEVVLVARGREDTSSYKLQLDQDQDDTFDETILVDGRTASEVLNPNIDLTPGEKVDLWGRAYSEPGQGGNQEQEVFDETYEVPALDGTQSDTRPDINVQDLDQITENGQERGHVDFTVADPDGLLTKVEVRTAAGRNFTRSDSYSDLSKTSGTYTAKVDLAEEHNSFIQVRLQIAGQEAVTRMFTFDRDQVPSADYQTKWFWNASRGTVELWMVCTGDEDVSSYEFGLDIDQDGTDDETVTVGDSSRVRSDTILLNPNDDLNPGDSITATATAYSETGQGGNEQPEDFEEVLQVPTREQAISNERPIISAELKEPDFSTGRLEWTVDDPDDVVTSVEVRTKQGGNFDGERFSSPSETNPYAEEVELVPLHNSYIEVRLVTGPGVENVRQTYTFDPDDEAFGDITLAWNWTGSSQELTVGYVGDDDVESWKFEADLDDNNTFETTHTTNNDAGTQTINPSTTLNGGDTIGLKVTAYTENGQGGNAKVLFDGTLEVPLPRDEVPLARPTITGETLEPDETTGRVEWTVDDPDNVVNSVEVRTKQGENFDGEGFASPSETNPYAEDVTIGPTHNSFIEVRLVTEPGIDNVRTLFVFDPDDNPHGTVELRWRWNYSRTSQELTVNYVGDNDVESWKFQADLDNNGTFETEYNTNNDAGAQTINPNTTLSGGDTIGLKITCYAKGGQSGNSKVLFNGSLDVPLHREEVPEARASITVEDIQTFRSSGDLFGEVEWTYDDPDGIVNDTDVRVAVGENLRGGFRTPDDDTSPFSETVTIGDKHTSYIEVRLVTDSGYDNVRQVFPFDADTYPEGSVELRWEYDSSLGGIKGVIVTTGDDDVESWKFTISDGSNQDTQYVDGQSVTEQLNKSYGLDPGQTVSINADAYARQNQNGLVTSILNSETFVVMADIDAVADGDGVVIEGKHILLDGSVSVDGGLDLFQTAYQHPALKQAIQDGKLIERVSFTHPNDASGTELTGPLNGRRYKFQDGATMVSGNGPYDVACKIDQSAGSEPRVAVEFSVSSADPDVAVGGWFKVPEGNTGGVLFSMDASEYFRVIVGSGGNLQVSDNLASSAFDTGRRIDDGRWHHVQIAYRKQGSTTRILVYVDGSIYIGEEVSGSLGSGNTRYLMVGVGSEATSYDGSTGGGGQITFYCQDLFCFKGGGWDNDLAVPMAANPDAFSPIGRVHGDLLVEDTIRSEVLDVEQIFATNLQFTGELQQVQSGDLLFAITGGSDRRVLIRDDNGNTTGLLTKQGNLEINQISGYDAMTGSANTGSGWPGDVEDWLVVQTANGGRVVPAVLPPDTIDPKAPTNLSAYNDPDSNSVEVDWSQVTEDVNGNSETIDHYNVYRDTSSHGNDLSQYAKIGSVEAGTTKYDDFAVEDNTTYYYRVSAIDDAGNEGDGSNEAQVTTEFDAQFE